MKKTPRKDLSSRTQVGVGQFSTVSTFAGIIFLSLACYSVPQVFHLWLEKLTLGWLDLEAMFKQSLGYKIQFCQVAFKGVQRNEDIV